MANEKNLIPLNQRGKEEAKRIRQMGQAAQKEKQRRRKSLRESMNALREIVPANTRDFNKLVRAGIPVEEIKSLPGGKAKEKLLAELNARSYASQQDRLSQFEGQINMEIDRLILETEGQMTLTMTDILEDGYYHKAFDLQQRAGVFSPFAVLQKSMIEDVLTYPWSGADFSDRIWENKRALLFNARQTITQGIIQGHSAARMANDIADTMGKSYKAAERLVRTETNHIHAEADKLAYRAAGVKEYEFMATLDARTCEVCGALDGKHFPISEAKTGVNYPPMHPNDRCTTVEYDPEDAADWAASGKPMPENMTYDEWKKRIDKTVSNGIIKSSDIEIGKSVGAAAHRDKVNLPQGGYGKVAEGTRITKVVTFAGKGTNKKVKVAEFLSKQYGVPVSEWKKVRGDGYVETQDGIVRHAELHWFESDETGRVKMKVKRYFDDES